MKNNLKALRIAKGMSQSQLSMEARVTVMNISKLESGVIDIGKSQLNTVYALSKALDCKIEDLIDE